MTIDTTGETPPPGSPTHVPSAPDGLDTPHWWQVDQSVEQATVSVARPAPDPVGTPIPEPVGVPAPDRVGTPVQEPVNGPMLDTALDPIPDRVEGPTPGGPGDAGRDTPPGPRSSGSGRVWLFLVLAVLAIGVLGFVGSKAKNAITGGSPVGYGELAISNAEAILIEAEQSLATMVTEADAVMSKDSGCWFSYSSADTDLPNGFLRCGPALFLDSEIDAPWVKWDIGFIDDPENDRAMIAQLGTVSSRSSALSSGEVLRRPDGREAPTTIDLELPPPPPVDQEYVALLESDAKVDLQEPVDGRIYSAGDVRIEILGVGTTDEIGSGPERMIAPEGHDLMVIKFESTGDGAVASSGFYDDDDQGSRGGSWSVSDDSASEQANLVLAIDGAQRPLPGWGGSGPHRFVITVPSDAKEIDLTLEQHGIRSTFSLTSLERTAGSPALYVKKRSVPVQRTYRSTSTYVTEYDSDRNAVFDGRVSTVDLKLLDADNGSASPGSAFVSLNWSTLSLDMGLSFGTTTEWDTTRSAKVLVDGVEYAPVSVTRDTVVFEVPEDTTQVTVTFSPVVLYTTGISSPRSGEIIFPDTLSLTVDFSTGTVS